MYYFFTNIGQSIKHLVMQYNHSEAMYFYFKTFPELTENSKNYNFDFVFALDSKCILLLLIDLIC